MSTTRDGVLTRGARGIGALVCLLLALLTAVWIIRDLTIAQHGTDLWWTWLGEARRPREFTAWATSALDPLLTLGALVVAVAAVRTAVPRPWPTAHCSPGGRHRTAAPPAGVGAGRRLAPGAGQLLTARARLTAVTQLALAAALVVVVVAGRRRGGRADRYARHTVHGLPQAASSAYGVVHAVPSGAGPERPGRPYKGAAVTAGVLLGAAGLAVAGWEIHWQRRLDGDVYRKGCSGTRPSSAPCCSPGALAVGGPRAAGPGSRGRRTAPRALGPARGDDGRGPAAGARSRGARLRRTHRGVRPPRRAAAPGPAGGGHRGLRGGRRSGRADRGGLPWHTDASHPMDGVLAYGSAPGEARPPHAPPPPSRLPPGW
ncbi:hypothetical protein O1L68_13850 [Streptomyces lydicus]|nr:hypothetical protein [Streptomyces lydicus]